MTEPNTLDEQIDQIVEDAIGTGVAWIPSGKSEKWLQIGRENATQQLRTLFTEHRKQEVTPTHIMGRPIDEVITILSGLELERIEDLKMTMSNLGEWVKIVQADHRKAMQKAIDKTFEDFTAQLKRNKGE